MTLTVRPYLPCTENRVTSSSLRQRMKTVGLIRPRMQHTSASAPIKKPHRWSF